MRWLDIGRSSTAALRANPLRSALTALGVIFGVASVVLMISIGSGTERRMQEEVEKIGTNLIVVRAGTALASGIRLGTGTRPTITEEDAAALLNTLPQVSIVAPLVGGDVQVTNGVRNWTTPLLGVTQDFFDAREWRVAEGEDLFLDGRQAEKHVALIGRTVVEKLFDTDPLGEIIRVNHVPFKIVGILESKGQTLNGTDLDDTVMASLDIARDSILGRPSANARSVGTIIVKVRDANDVSAVLICIKGVLRERHRIRESQPDDFEISNLAESMRTRADLSSAMTQLLTAVASISLLVGGIGIMNIMLVSVTERTGEIGLRMAVGATPSEILAQFLSEAVVLSLTGGFMGAVLGLAAAWLAHTFFAYRIYVTAWPATTAFAFSALVGVVFGIYPALRAARQSPMAALRRE